MKESFTETEMLFIVNVIRHYEEMFNNGQTVEDGRELGELYDMVNKIKNDKMKFRPEPEIEIDGNLLQMINIIFTNKCVRQAISSAQNPIIIPFICQFIKDFEDLKGMAKLKLYVTGTEEEARDKRLRQAYKSTVLLKATFKDLEQQLETQRQQLGNELNQKVEIFERYNNKIANIREEFQISIEKTIHESEKKMMQQCLESEEKQAVLAVEADSITKQFEILMEDHLADEKTLRAKTMKTHAQLHNWLTKYDQEIGDKQSEYEELKEQYDKEKELMDDLEEKLDDQEHLYNTLMAEKEEEERRIYEEIAYKLLINRAARIIQRAWRAYRERRKRRGRRGKKKGKDGKKSRGKN